MLKIYAKLANYSNKLNDLSLLIVRLILAYGFFEPAKMKWSNISSVADWFGSMGIPFPTLNAYMAASTEALGVILLVLGLGSRLISVPLIIIMLVAIFTVHFSNGFGASNNGFEIPLYYMIMLIVLLSNGSGKLSIDCLLKRKLKSENK